jgi:hypothetical protein
MFHDLFHNTTKAIDELTIGMQFYVLFTLSHSAIKSPSTQPISFKYNTTRRIKNIRCKEAREIIMPQPFDRDIFNKQVEIFIKIYATKDLTCLLNHIQEVSKTDIGREYYNEKMVETLSELSKFVRYFYHRNYFVVESSDQSMYKSIAENQMAVAKIFFDNHFFDDFPKEIEDSYNRCTAWEKSICQKLKSAAFDHFKNARNIQRMFKSVFDNTAQENDFLGNLGKLHQIKDVKTDETKAIHQFVVIALWTRFGSIRLSDQEKISESVAENDDDLGAFITKKTKTKPQHLKVECIIRHGLALENNDLITTEKSFNVDPIGITHLDVINRAIDITLLALRRILHKALTQPNEPGLRYNYRINRNTLLSSLLDMKNKNGVCPLVKENFSNSNLYFFKEEKVEDEIKIVEDFNQRCGLDSNDVAHFINSSAHFADPRFMGEFLKRQTDRFLLAKQLVKIRDNATHQLNLHCSDKLKIDTVYDNISHLKCLIDEVADKLAVLHSDFVESKALVQLYRGIYEYQKWRKRQGFAINLSDDDWYKTSKEMIEGLVEKKGILEPVDDEDNSQEALEYLFRFYIFVYIFYIKSSYKI